MQFHCIEFWKFLQLTIFYQKTRAPSRFFRNFHGQKCPNLTPLFCASCFPVVLPAGFWYNAGGSTLHIKGDPAYGYRDAPVLRRGPGRRAAAVRRPPLPRRPRRLCRRRGQLGRGGDPEGGGLRPDGGLPRRHLRRGEGPHPGGVRRRAVPHVRLGGGGPRLPLLLRLPRHPLDLFLRGDRPGPRRHGRRRRLPAGGLHQPGGDGRHAGAGSGIQRTGRTARRPVPPL